MNVRIEPSWGLELKDAFESGYFQKLTGSVRDAYARTTCYPKAKDIFNAFDLCPFDHTRVVIIGQDPYHGPGQAHGLCFSVRQGVPFPPSLANIYKELQTDLGLNMPASGDLSRWATQGVLLLNATLTVEAGKPGSHQGLGWETFTDQVIELLNRRKHNLVFLLWGGFARRKGARIDRSRHCVLECGHPSPLSANRGLWFGNRHFSQTNTFLSSTDQEIIRWK